MDAEPTWNIDDLKAAVEDAGRAAMRAALALACHLLEQVSPFCPRGAGTAGCRDGHEPRTIGTSIGQVGVLRRRWRCRPCCARYQPLGRLLTPLGAGMLAMVPRQVCMEVGASWPYPTVARFVVCHTGAQISTETARQCVLTSGRDGAGEVPRCARCVVRHSLDRRCPPLLLSCAT